LVALLIALPLTGCASFPDLINVLFGRSAQKITRTPIWVYRPDLELGVGGIAFQGMAVSGLEAVNDIQVQSPVHIDRVEVSTCSRHDVCQVKGGYLACDLSRFTVDTGWFGSAGKYMTYRFIPDEREKRDSCSNLTIEIYDKNALAAWGYVFLRTSPEIYFPASFTCNATDWKFSGVSVCSAKAGTLQEIRLPAAPAHIRADDSCGLKKITDTKYEFQPAVGWCRASFELNKKFHDVVLSGYDEVLIRN
jgi:hypothetical protein